MIFEICSLCGDVYKATDVHKCGLAKKKAPELTPGPP